MAIWPYADHTQYTFIIHTLTNRLTDKQAGRQAVIKHVSESTGVRAGVRAGMDGKLRKMKERESES